MRDNPFLALLDRDTVVFDVKKHFQDEIDLLQELVNYGTNLIPRCFSSSDRQIADIIILPVLLKHVVTMLDGIEILVSQGAIFSAHVPARSHFEACLYIKWILKDDSETRAKQYYIWHLRQKRNWAKRIIKGHKEHEKFFKSIAKFGPGLKKKQEALENEAKKQVKEIDRLLNSAVYEEIDKEFENRETKGSPVSWFTPRGPRSISDLASRLDHRAEYDILYSHYSKIMHGVALSEHIVLGNDQASFKPIRNLQGISGLVTTVLSFTLEIYRIILSHYRREELQNFKTKYVNEWRKRFRVTKNVEYKSDSYINL
ncbi:DUF5677 domain-containing protein [bacterium]|nr:DUF5677 domain-containing protein [bacterium]